MLGLVIGAAILGLIIAVMEEDGFPGWLPMIICVLAAVVPASVVNVVLPPGLFFIGLGVGAVCAGCAISAVCGMTVKRATIAAAIYLAVQVGISVVMSTMMRT